MSIYFYLLDLHVVINALFRSSQQLGKVLPFTHWVHMAPVNSGLQAHCSWIFMANGILQSHRSAAARLGTILWFKHFSHPVEKSEFGSMHRLQSWVASKRGFLHTEHVAGSYFGGQESQLEPVHFPRHPSHIGGALLGNLGHEMLQNGNCRSPFTHSVQFLPLKPARHTLQSDG